jgi:hypothetical protein
VWNVGDTSLTLFKETATVNLTNAGASARTVTVATAGRGPANLKISAGTGTVNLSSNLFNVDFTGFSGTLDTAGTSVTWDGTIILSATMTTADDTDTIFTRGDGATAGSLTTNGCVIRKNINISGNSATHYNLLDDFTCTRTFTVTQGVLNTNNHAVTVNNFVGGGATKTLNLGSSLITLTASSGTPWNPAPGFGTLTLNAGTSTIKFTDTGNNNLTFAGAIRTYHNLYFSRGASTGNNIVTGTTNTFNDIKDDGTEAHGLHFTDTATNTVTTFTVNGSAGKLITITSAAGAANHNLIKAGGGTITCDYVSVSKSDAAPAVATWFATNSTDGGGNSGWDFGVSSSNSNFFALL